MEWLLLFPGLPSHKHAEERQEPVSCNQTVCSAPAMQRTPSEKLQNITSEVLIYHTDEIMKLVLSGSFYSFSDQLTSNFLSTTKSKTSPLLAMGMWLHVGSTAATRTRPLQEKITPHPPTTSLHKQWLGFFEITVETYHPLRKTNLEPGISSHRVQKYLVDSKSEHRSLQISVIAEFTLSGADWRLEWSITEDSVLLHATYTAG